MWLTMMVVLSGLPAVDPARRALDTCDAEAVAQRTPTDAWFSDACGRVFRSSDGGDGWARDEALEAALLGRLGDGEAATHRHVTHLAWSSEEVGLATVSGWSGLDAEARVQPARAALRRTLDGGQTWATLSSSLTGPALALAARELDVWLCDAHGRVHHSKDGGLSWKPPTEPVFDRDDGCAGLAAIGPSEVLLLGRRSLRWSTDGTSWKSVRLPSANRLAQIQVREGAWHLSDQAQRAWSSVDRGQHWTALAATDPMDLLRRRARQPTTPGSAERWTLERVAEGRQQRWGTRGAAVFNEHDTTWVRLADLPAPADGLLVLRSGAALVHTQTGLFVSNKGGWAPAGAADQARWRVLSEPARPVGPTPLDCLQEEPGFVEVRWREDGCFGGTGGRVLVELRAEVGHVLVTDDVHRTVPRVDREVQATQGRELVRRIAQRAFAEALPDECRSTDHFTATLSWSCGLGPRQTQEFVTEQCNAQENAEAPGASPAVTLRALAKTLADAEGGRPFP